VRGREQKGRQRNEERKKNGDRKNSNVTEREKRTKNGTGQR